MQNDSRPCPSLHGHHSTSLTMPQGKVSKDTLLSYMQLLVLRQKTRLRACVCAEIILPNLNDHTKYDDDSNFINHR